MKRIGYVVLAEIVLAGVLVSLAGAQSSESLGDYARSVRKEEKKGSAKKYDNDNLPATDKISVVGNAQPEASTQPGSAEDANPGSTPEANVAQTGDSSHSARRVQRSMSAGSTERTWNRCRKLRTGCATSPS